MSNNKNIKGLLLLGDGNSILQETGSVVNIITHKDSLLIKTYKYSAEKGISSSIKDKLFIENPDIVNWVILYNESTLKTKDVLIFCEEHKYNLLVLKEELKLNKDYDFKIIHNPNLINCKSIYDTIKEESI